MRVLTEFVPVVWKEYAFQHLVNYAVKSVLRLASS